MVIAGLVLNVGIIWLVEFASLIVGRQHEPEDYREAMNVLKKWELLYILGDPTSLCLMPVPKRKAS